MYAEKSKLNPLTNQEKVRAKHNNSLYEHKCWKAFNKVIKLLRNYMETEMYSDKDDLSEREVFRAIHTELQVYKNKFMTLCSNDFVPLFKIKLTDAYKTILGLTNTYAHHATLSGHKYDDPRIYYQNTKPNLDTKHNKNHVSYFKLKLTQFETCGIRKVKNTPYDLSI